ncbi:hypothetical protein ACIBI2_43600, partial [Streptosporangium canum]
MIMIALGLVAPIFGVIKGETWGWTSWGTLGALAAGAVLLAVFGWYETRGGHPLLPMRLFRSPSLTIGTTERGDLIALGCDLGLGHHRLDVVAGGGQQVGYAVAGAAAAQGCAVHGQAGWRRSAVRCGHWWRGGQPGQVGACHSVEGVTVE